MPLSVYNIPGRRGYAILEGVDFQGCSACTFEYLGQFVGADGRLAKAPFACPVAAMPGRSDALVLGPHIVDFIHDEVLVTVRGATGDELGRVFWSGIVRSATEGSITPDRARRDVLLATDGESSGTGDRIEREPVAEVEPDEGKSGSGSPRFAAPAALALVLGLGFGALFWFGFPFGTPPGTVRPRAIDPPAVDRRPATPETPEAAPAVRTEAPSVPAPRREPAIPEPPTQRAGGQCPDTTEAFETGLAKSIAVDGRELDEAERLLLCARASGSPDAARKLARLYVHRAELANSVAAAKSFYKKACDLSDEEGCRKYKLRLDADN